MTYPNLPKSKQSKGATIGHSVDDIPIDPPKPQVPPKKQKQGRFKPTIGVSPPVVESEPAQETVVDETDDEPTQIDARQVYETQVIDDADYEDGDAESQVEDENYALDIALMDGLALAPAYLRQPVDVNESMARSGDIKHRDAIFAQKHAPVIGLDMKVNVNKDKDYYNLKWTLDDVTLKAQYIYSDTPFLDVTEYGLDPQYTVFVHEEMLKCYAELYNGDVWLVFHIIYRDDVKVPYGQLHKMAGVWVAHASALFTAFDDDDPTPYFEYIGPIPTEWGDNDGSFLVDVSQFPCYSFNSIGMPFKMDSWSKHRNDKAHKTMYS